MGWGREGGVGGNKVLVVVRVEGREGVGWGKEGGVGG